MSRISQTRIMKPGAVRVQTRSFRPIRLPFMVDLTFHFESLYLGVCERKWLVKFILHRMRKSRSDRDLKRKGADLVLRYFNTGSNST